MRFFVGLFAGLLGMANPLHAQDVTYVQNAAKANIIAQLERMVDHPSEGLKVFQGHPSSKNIEIPAELQTYITQNAILLRDMIERLKSIDRMPVDMMNEYLARSCEATVLNHPVAILQEIGTSRFPPSCGSCEKSKIDIALPTTGVCREIPLDYTKVFGEYREYGEAEALELLDRSLAWRFTPVHSHIIGSVNVDTSGNSGKELDLIQTLTDAQSAYISAREARDLRLEQLAKAQQANAAEVADLRRPVRALRAEIAAQSAKGEKDPDTVRASRQYLLLSDRIDAAAKRGDQIDAAVKNLFENYPAGDTFAQDRIRILQAEQEQVVAGSEIAQAARDELSLPERTATEIADIRALEDNLFVITGDANRRIWLADSSLDSAVNLLDGAEEALMPLEAKLDAALKAHREFKLVSGQIFAKLTTDHATFENPGEIPDIAPLNALIRVLADRQRVERREMEAARKDMLRAFHIVESRSLELRNAGYSSLFRQFMTEVGFSVYDLVDAAKRGKMPGVVAEAWTQFGLNLLFGVTYEDGQTGNLEEFKAMREAAEPREWLEYKELTGWGHRVGDQIGKHLLSLPKETQLAYFDSLRGVKAANASHGSVMKAIEASIADTGMADIRQLMKPYAASLAEQEKLAKRFAELSGNKGFKASSKAAARGFLGGMAKEMIKELAKEEIAEMVEQPAFNRYMNAQVDLSLAYLKSRYWAAQYWPTTELLNNTRRSRDTFLEAYDGLDPQTGWQEVRNEPWFASGKYGFWLDLTDEGQKLVRDLGIDVELEGIKLIRNETTTELGWRIPDGMAGKLYDGLPEKLSVVIKVR
jgi:HEPN domain-containing protein